MKVGVGFSLAAHMPKPINQPSSNLQLQRRAEAKMDLRQQRRVHASYFTQPQISLTGMFIIDLDRAL
jgi:hypothetical protein